MYLDDLASKIRAEVPTNDLPEGDADSLFRGYAVLLLAKGPLVTAEDVHNAWSLWMSSRVTDHKSLIPYDSLGPEVAAADLPYMHAIRTVALKLTATATLPSGDEAFLRTLVPYGLPTDEKDRDRIFDLYKLMVTSSESLVGRRQAVNTFFITIQGALVAGVGLFLKGDGNLQMKAVGVAVLMAIGIALGWSWRTVLVSFGQLNRGKFKVINTLEKIMPASIFTAEWLALGEGKDPALYRSFTSREVWVPWAFVALYAVAFAISILAATKVLHFGT